MIQGVLIFSFLTQETPVGFWLSLPESLLPSWGWSLHHAEQTPDKKKQASLWESFRPEHFSFIFWWNYLAVVSNNPEPKKLLGSPFRLNSLIQFLKSKDMSINNASFWKEEFDYLIFPLWLTSLVVSLYWSTYVHHGVVGRCFLAVWCTNH